MNSFLKWFDERTGFCACCQKVANWTVPAALCGCRFLPTSLVFLFLLQGLTGLFLWAFYSPSASTAWESVYYIQYCLPFGWLLRGIHHYSAQLFVALSGLYVLLLILHGSYRRPREFVYWSALVMFLFGLASCLTGDLLPWSLSGYFATITRVSFLQLLPVVGVPLYQLVVGGPDPQFGTLTLTRFLVLHICVFGGGGFVVLCFWKYFDVRSRNLFIDKKSAFNNVHSCALACATKKRRAFWSWEALLSALVCLVVFVGVLLLVFQRSLTPQQIADREPTLPAESYLGAELTSPADPASSYDAARPEWSFRALYHMTKLPIFSQIGMVYAIFVIPPFLLAFFFVLPILGRSKSLHYCCVLTTFVLFVVFCRFTFLSYWDDYRNPEHAPGFLTSQADAERLAGRSIELANAPAGIPKTGALELVQNDAFVQGPKLFAQHCASCHNFEAKDDALFNADYREIICDEPTAPNLYGAHTAEWIRGFTNLETLADVDCFGATAFAEKGSMVGFMTGRVAGGAVLEDGSFMLNGNGLIAKTIAADASPAFDILEAVFEDFVADEENLAILDKILNEDGELDDEAVAAAQEEYVAKIAELIAAKFDDVEFVAELDPQVPAPILAALETVLKNMLSDETYRELLFDEEAIEYVQDEDAATFLTDSYLATLNGNDEPIPSDALQYVDALRAAVVASCDAFADILAEEAKLDAPRPFVGGEYLGLAPNAVADAAYLTCTECHAFYGVEMDHACDLRGYMSRNWIAGIIADPTASQFYGKLNDRMPAYCPTEGDKLMTEAQVGMLADWLSGTWYRAPEVANDSRLGTFEAAKTASREQAKAQAEIAAAQAEAQAALDAQIAEETAAKAAADAEKAKADEEKAKQKADEKAQKEAEEKAALKAELEKARAEAKAALEKAAASESETAQEAARAVEKAQAETSAAKTETEAARAETAAEKATREAAEQKLAEAAANLEKAQADQKAAQEAAATQIQDVQVAAQKQIEAAQAERQKAFEERAATTAKLEAAQAEFQKAQAEIVELQRQLDAAQAAASQPAPESLPEPTPEPTPEPAPIPAE